MFKQDIQFLLRAACLRGFYFALSKVGGKGLNKIVHITTQKSTLSKTDISGAMGK